MKAGASAVAATLVLIAGSVQAQQVQPEPPQAPPSTVFRSGSALVSLNVTVQDTAAKFVPGLQSSDFAVYEDGVKQDVRFFESNAVPVDLIVLIDTSSSMGFCAEHAAVAEMVKARESQIAMVVAVGADGVMAPCGRCRELMLRIDPRNRDTQVVVGPSSYLALAALLPQP